MAIARNFIAFIESLFGGDWYLKLSDLRRPILTAFVGYSKLKTFYGSVHGVRRIARQSRQCLC